MVEIIEFYENKVTQIKKQKNRRFVPCVQLNFRCMGRRLFLICCLAPFGSVWCKPFEIFREFFLENLIENSDYKFFSKIFNK